MANCQVEERLESRLVQATGSSKASCMIMVRLGFVAEVLTVLKASRAHNCVVLKTLAPQEMGSLTSSSPITVSAYSRI